MKNLFKKIGALLVAAVMVLSMCTAVFADDRATITLTNFADADSLKYMQIIEPDQTQPTGWKFSNEVAENAFKAATKKDAQTTLWMLILKANPDATSNRELNIPEGTTAISNADIDKALSTIKSNKVAQWTTLENKESLDVSVAGVYAFDAKKDKYTYKIATAYVGFGAYDKEKVPTLQNTSVEAKRSHLDIEKTVGDEDHAVAIGDVVEYTIKTYVPYIDANNTGSRTFRITDKIKGADYVLGEDGNVAGTVVLGDGKNATSVGTTIVPNENDKHSFEINLDSLVANADNPNAGVLVTVKYNAKITSVTVENTAKGHKSDETYGGTNDNVKLYTGTIVLTKIDAKSETTKLANAEFTVHEVTTKDNQEVVGEALTFDYDEKTGVYTYNPDSRRTTVVTNANGEVTVKGLDKGKYHFKETKAPNGYSINEAGADINLTFEGNVAKAEFKNTSGKLKDSRLSSLPSTGGMGTYLFTIIGVVVMAGAAGAFFISRRKGSEE